MATVERKNGGAPSAEITPEEAASIRASAARGEQAPSTRQQTALFENWRDVRDVLGDPFEVERIPISKLRAMRRDPILGFGLSFIKTPHVRSKWFVNAKDRNGPNPRVASHLDHDMRRVFPSIVLQFANALDFGFQASAKRFEFRIPAATYIERDEDTGEETEVPVWDEGRIQPIAFKPFVALPPEGVEPNWTNQGEFDGINYKPPTGKRPAPGIGASPRQKNSPDDPEEYDIDLWHSLWFTNERDQNFGSLFGYPRLGYAYKYWWSYWFRWAIADRAFERKADPSVKIYHPDQEVDLGDGVTMPAGEYALMMGERMRSGGVIALPSEPYEDANGRGTMRQWEIDFTKDATNFDPFDKSFEYLDVQKLRALWIPEQAFFEGKGGTSSRNVAAEMGESFMESQAVLAAQILEHINRWVIPQWLAVNYPEFLSEGGSAQLVMTGFADQDVEFTKQIIQLIGQQEQGMRELLKMVDLRRVLEESGTPIVGFTEQKRREAEIAAQAAASPPPFVEPAPGGLGVVPSATGFSYRAGPEVIHLADTANDFLSNLPSTQHYEDRTIKGFARQLWTLYNDLYEDEYETVIRAVEGGDDLEDIEAAEDLTDFDDVELALPAPLRRAARTLRNLPGSRLWTRTLERTQDIFGRIARRATKIELGRVNLSGQVDQADIDDFLRDHIAEFASQVAETTRKEVRNFMAKKVEEGIEDRAEIARLAREHFADFPQWKTDRLVRTEVRDVYNAATLLAARAAGVAFVQATDALYGPTDEDCENRDGKLFTLDEALRETEHPNGTLGWKIVPVTELSIERVPAEDLDGAVGRYDPENHKILLSDAASSEDHRMYQKLIGEALRAQV